jgi:glycerol-3-phosphate acyltransferase PlsX
MNIGLDMMGGDYAPAESVKGVTQFLKDAPAGVSLTLIGDPVQVQPLLDSAGGPQPSRYQLIAADQVIGMNEHPTRALKEKPRSSISIGFHLLQQKKIDAFISAGNTGAMLVGCLYSIKAMAGIQRPTIAAIIPKRDGRQGLLLDVGINADCKPENLVQFAILGTHYARHILKIPEPRVALLNIGEEEGKGNLLCQAAYPLLKSCPLIHFTGNVEGRDLFGDKADVIVCEGFTGNVVLKLAESLYDIIKKRNIQDEYLDQFNFEEYGGTPLLGVNEPVIIGHGISKGAAFCQMIEMTVEVIQTGLLDRIRESFTEGDKP